MVSGRGIFFSFWLFWTAQWAYHHNCSHFSLISQARKVKMRQFKSLKSSTWYWQCRKATGKGSSLFSNAQLAKMWANHQIFSHFSFISKARKVKMRQFKSLKSSIWYWQYREAIEKGRVQVCFQLHSKYLILGNSGELFTIKSVTFLTSPYSAWLRMNAP